MHAIFTALRQLRKSPGFAVTVILTIALGIGANTAIFTLVHAVLLRSLPVESPKALYAIGKDTSRGGISDGLPADGDFALFSYDLYRHMRETTPEFKWLAAVQSGTEGLTARLGSAPAKSEIIEYVSGNYFRTLGIQAFAGRLLAQRDDAPQAAPAVVMSYAAWQSDYGSNPSIVGNTLTLQEHPVTVIGIAPPGFYGDRISTNPPAFYVPLNLEPTIEGSSSVLKAATTNWLYLIGRVRPGVQIGQLQARMTANLRSWLETQPADLKNGGAAMIAKQQISLVPGGGGIQQMQENESSGLYLLMAISALVLLVACANVANLLLARGSAHRADTSLRMALGASRRRIVRQMLTESIVLSSLGGAGGLAIAYAGTKTILSLAFPDSPQLPIHASPSLPVLGFAFLLSLATGVLFGVVPAWITSHADPAEALRGANRSTRDRASLPQKGLIVFQAALSLVLLVGASLLTRSLAHLQDQDFGIETADRYVFSIDPAGAGYTVATLPALYQTLEQRFGSLPGVANVGLALYSPLSQDEWRRTVFLPGQTQVPDSSNRSQADYDRVSPRFFAAVGERLVRGRVFTQEDTAASQSVAVVNESFAHRFFPGQNPVGRYFGGSQSQPGGIEVVGVVADAKYVDPTTKPSAMYFVPLTQLTPGMSAGQDSRGMYIGSVVLDFQHQPTNVDALVRRAMADVNPNLTVSTLQTLAYQVNTNFTENLLLSRLAMLFGALALVLAAVGLYGITSYQVSRRTSEIGLRMALGATRGDVLRMVLRGAFRQVGLGLAIGIPVAIALGNSIASQLYGVNAWDPLSLLLAVAALSAAAAMAGLIPASRAASIEPVTALRID
jgi:predicted permease